MRSHAPAWRKVPTQSPVTINDDEGDAVTLHRIELEDGQASLPAAANIRLGGRLECTFVWNNLLVTMPPYPILVCFRGDRLDIPLSVPTPLIEIPQDIIHR